MLERLAALPMRRLPSRGGRGQGSGPRHGQRRAEVNMRRAEVLQLQGVVLARAPQHRAAALESLEARLDLLGCLDA